jgi:hypothetical protein
MPTWNVVISTLIDILEAANVLAMSNCLITDQTSSSLSFFVKLVSYRSQFLGNSPRATRELHDEQGPPYLTLAPAFRGLACIDRSLRIILITADLPPEHQTIWPGQWYQITRPLLIPFLY